MRIGVDLGGSKIEAAAIDGSGAIIARHRVTTPRDDYDRTVTTIVGLVDRLEAETEQTGTVGVGIPGTLSPATGRIKNANSTWLIGRPFDRDLAAALDRPVRLANDANCFALSEAIDGAGKDANLVFGVILGTGVGGGLVVDRRPVLGANAIAGEWGHNPLPWPDPTTELPGPPCYCGRKGCIETFLSGPGLRHDHAATTGDVLEPGDIADRAADDEPGAVASMGRYHDRLARALAHVINIFDPEVIVLGGGLSNIDGLYQTVPRLWDRFVFSDRVDTILARHIHGDSGGVRGAAWLWPETVGS